VGVVLLLLAACRSPAPAERIGESVGGTRYTLVDGTYVEGERIHTWDPSIWWQPMASTVDLVCAPEAVGPYPEDGSLRVIPAERVEDRTPIAREPGACARFQREHGRSLARSPLDVPAHVIMGNEGYHLEENGYGDFAWDLVVTDEAGRRFHGTGSRNEDYLVWDAEVVAPVSGRVVEVVDDAPDQRPGGYARDARNNYVGIQLDGQVYAYVLHLRPGSARVAVGDTVRAGDPIGRAGNAGVSLEPHVHVTLLYYDVAPIDGSPPRTWAIPSEWRDAYLADEPPATGRTVATRAEWSVPPTGAWVAATAF
jgi:hypothetical protein